MTSSATDLQAQASAIRAARLAQTQAIARGDIETVAKYWTTDITIRRALGHAVDGIEAARKVIVSAPNGTPRVIYQREPVDVEVSPIWPLAYEQGRWTAHLVDAATAPIMTGRYSAQWVSRGGIWLIRSEVFVALSGAGPGRDFVALD